MYVAEQRRRIVEASRRKRHRWLPTNRSLSHSLINQAANTIQLHWRDNRANVDGFVERWPGAQRAHAVAYFGNQWFSNAFLHQQAGSRAANLSLVEPDAIHQTLDCAVEIGILKNNKRRLPAQFERELLVSGSGCSAYGSSNFRRTRKRNLVDVGVLDQSFARGAVSGDDIYNSRRQSDFRAD